MICTYWHSFYLWNTVPFRVGSSDVLSDCPHISGWWFETFFIFPYIGKNHPNWLLFLRGVETTNQTMIHNGQSTISIWRFPRGYPNRSIVYFIDLKMKWMIWGYHHFKKPPNIHVWSCVYIYIYICTHIGTKPEYDLG